MRTLVAQMRDMVECRKIKPLLQSYLDGYINEETPCGFLATSTPADAWPGR